MQQQVQLQVAGCQWIPVTPLLLEYSPQHHLLQPLLPWLLPMGQSWASDGQVTALLLAGMVRAAQGGSVPGLGVLLQREEQQQQVTAAAKERGGLLLLGVPDWDPPGVVLWVGHWWQTKAAAVWLLQVVVVLAARVEAKVLAALKGPQQQHWQRLRLPQQQLLLAKHTGAHQAPGVHWQGDLCPTRGLCPTLQQH